MSRDAWKRYSAEGSLSYEVICPGLKYNMTDIQAAMGLHQLLKLPQFQGGRPARDRLPLQRSLLPARSTADPHRAAGGRACLAPLRPSPQRRIFPFVVHR
jgi:hypothetical protein